MPHRFLNLVSSLLISTFSSLSQTSYKITGQTLEGARISLLRASDSSLQKLAIASASGYFEMDQLPKGTYHLEITALGFSTYFSEVIRLTETFPIFNAGKITLSKSPTSLDSITITASKRIIEIKPDRTILNVDAGISNAGASALEVLEKAPGISVDRDGNIRLKGRQGVLILIDGKPSYLSGSDLVNLLTTMMSNQLDQIEIMTNPPAKYDAAGNSGIVNIKTKKNKQRGWNGSLNISYGQGAYYKTNNGLNLNYKNEKLTIFLNYSQNASKNFNNLYIKRKYRNETGDSYTGFFDQPTLLKMHGHNNTLKIGADYSISQKTTFGIIANGFISPRTYNSVSTGYLMDADRDLDSIVQTISANSNRWLNGSINLNFRQVINKNSELSADLDYIQYDMTNNQLFHNTIRLANESVLSDGYLRGYLPAYINIYTAKADYTNSLPDEWKLEAGVKTSRVNTNNEAKYANAFGSGWKPDYGKTNHFLYQESIYAGYLNANKKLGKWSLQGGLRFEHTQYNGNQLGNPEKNDSSFKRNYSNLFPSLYITNELDSNHTITIQSGRRIDRPAYQQLNPFLFFINEYTYQVGNPYIQPQYTWNFQLTHTYKGWLTTSLEMGDTRQYFSQIFKTEGSVTILTEGNLASMKNLNLSITTQLRPLKWWSATINITSTYQKVRGNGTNQDFNSEVISGNGNINNQFKFNKGWSAELSGFYNAKNKDAQFVIFGFGQLTAGIGKQIWKGKGTIRLNIRDVFFTQQITGDIRYQNVREHFKQSRDTRVATFSFNWRFGKQLSESKKKTGGSGEEQNRVRAGG